MRGDTKLARVREAMRASDWDTALKLASKFQRLGEHEAVIKRAANAVNNPSFYRQIGQDVEQLKKEGIAALITRFSKSWDSVRPGAPEKRKR
jgi:hypothetical protein